MIAVLLLTLPLLMLAASHLSAISAQPEDRGGDSPQQSERRSAGAGQPEGREGGSPHRAGTSQLLPCFSSETAASSACPRLSSVWGAVVTGPGPARTAVHRTACTAWGVSCIVSFTVYALSLGGVVRVVGEFVGVPSTLALIQVCRGV